MVTGFGMPAPKTCMKLALSQQRGRLMKMNPLKAVFFMVALLMLFGLMAHSPAIAGMNYYNFNIANQTSGKVNCQNVVYTWYYALTGQTGHRSHTVSKKTWQAGRTETRRYATQIPWEKSTFQAYCVCLADGWPRQFNILFDDPSNMNASFKIDNSGKCILTK
jgi:hypothetical protein